MTTIKKYPLTPLCTVLVLSKGSKVLRIMTTQTGAILWIAASEDLEFEDRSFQVFYEGQEIPEGAEYIDSFSLDNGYTHRHLFEIKSENY